MSGDLGPSMHDVMLEEFPKKIPIHNSRFKNLHAIYAKE